MATRRALSLALLLFLEIFPLLAREAKTVIVFRGDTNRTLSTGIHSMRDIAIDNRRHNINNFLVGYPFMSISFRPLRQPP